MFYKSAHLTTLNIGIPTSLTLIPESTFNGCAALTSFTIPTQVKEIGKNAFNGCASLTSVTLSDNITKVGDTAFANCTSLASVTLGKNITSIGAKAFQLAGITSLTIPSNYKSSVFSATSSGVFDQCTALTTVIFELDGEGKSAMTEITAYLFIGEGQK